MNTKRLLLSYFILIHLILVIILIKSDIVEKIKINLEIKHPISTNHYQTMVSFHRRVDKNIPTGSILFIGDSHIQGLAVSAVTTHTVNYGIGGDTTLGVIQRLPTYKSSLTAKAIVLAIGYNDLKYRSNFEIIKNVEKILLSIKSTIILCAINKIDERILNKLNYNQRIIDINQHLLEISHESKNITFLNINTYIAKNGNLSSAYHIGDGIHLNQDGYDIWIHHLKLALN